MYAACLQRVNAASVNPRPIAACSKLSSVTGCVSFAAVEFTARDFAPLTSTASILRPARTAGTTNLKRRFTSRASGTDNKPSSVDNQRCCARIGFTYINTHLRQCVDKSAHRVHPPAAASCGICRQCWRIRFSRPPRDTTPTQYRCYVITNRRPGHPACGEGQPPADTKGTPGLNFSCPVKTDRHSRCRIQRVAAGQACTWFTRPDFRSLFHQAHFCTPRGAFL